MPAFKRLFKRLYGLVPFKPQLFKLLRSTVKVPEKVFRHLNFKGVIKVPVEGRSGFRMMHHGYMIENELFWRGLDGWEKISFRLWTLLCRDAKVILDIGANTGVYSLIAQAVRPDAVIVAAEPVTRIHAKLKGNSELNGSKVLAVHAAISDHTGTATLYDMPDEEHVLSVSMEQAWNKESTKLRPVQVPCLTVMDLLKLAERDQVDLLKIDVETHEPAVLRGFHELIKRDRPTMLIEILTDEVAAQVAEMISGLDYVYYNIDDVSWPPPKVATLSRSGHFNFLICRPEVALGIGL